MKQSRRLAFCGMTTALAIVVQVLGGWLGLGTYICPMLAGLLLLPIGREWGGRWQLAVWLAVGLLDLVLVSDLEESLMFLCFFGWYPVLYARLNKLPKLWRWPVKLGLFNAVIIPLEALLMLVIAPESIQPVLVAVLLVLGNLVFICYDQLLPRMTELYERRLRPILKK